jgi:hypothetical protein
MAVIDGHALFQLPVRIHVGLLHGLGFASPLADIGLPQSDILLALSFLNVRVEIGQLMFIGVVLGALSSIRRLGVPATARPGGYRSTDLNPLSRPPTARRIP